MLLDALAVAAQGAGPALGQQRPTGSALLVVTVQVDGRSGHEPLERAFDFDGEDVSPRRFGCRRLREPHELPRERGGLPVCGEDACRVRVQRFAVGRADGEREAAREVVGGHASAFSIAVMPRLARRCRTFS